MYTLRQSTLNFSPYLSLPSMRTTITITVTVTVTTPRPTDKLRVFNVGDRKQYDMAWQGYYNQNPRAEGTLKSSLRALEAAVAANGGGALVKQPASVAASVEALLDAANEFNDSMHATVKAFCMTMGARDYVQGPVKSGPRVLEKAAKDYGNDFRQIIGELNKRMEVSAYDYRCTYVNALRLASKQMPCPVDLTFHLCLPPHPLSQDVVRSSAVFHSLIGLNGSIMALLNPGGDIQVVRIKDRINNPLDSGYRDVLLNLVVKGSPVVMELQLHLKDVIALKEGGHRIYGEPGPCTWPRRECPLLVPTLTSYLAPQQQQRTELLRTLGWEHDEVDAEMLTQEEVSAAAPSATSRRAVAPEPSAAPAVAPAPATAAAESGIELAEAGGVGRHTPGPGLGPQLLTGRGMESVQGESKVKPGVSRRAQIALSTDQLGTIFKDGQRVVEGTGTGMATGRGTQAKLVRYESEEGDVDE